MIVLYENLSVNVTFDKILSILMLGEALSSAAL